MIYHHEKQEAVIKALSSNYAKGLVEAQVLFRREQYGKNSLRAGKKENMLQRFAAQFQDAMILILIAAALISFVVAITEKNPKGFAEPILILLIVLLNALMGVLQESKAEKALEALKGMSALHARVIRKGQEKIIDAASLVPGDIIKLEAGDFIPADARLLKSASLKSDEATLTGESVPSEKNADAVIEEAAPLGDQSNMIFSGCSVTSGTATAIVTDIGMETQMGKIAALLDNQNLTKTPLQKKLAQLGKHLGVLALVACAIIFVIGITNGIPVMEIFMTSVSLAVSAIPEGLPAIVTIVLSIGVQRMVKKNAIIRRLPAVETLGSASVICSDKTGTLTQNRMTLTKVYLDETRILEDINTQNSQAVRQLLLYGTLCCNGSVVFSGGREQHIGDPTETAIIKAAYKNGLKKEELSEQYPRIAEIPFDSDRRLMSVVCRMNGTNRVIVKGAFDNMMPRCIAGDLQAARKINEEMSKSALRVLAIAVKEIDALSGQPSSEELESRLIFLGLVGMIDPPRPEAKAAVELCRKAGIKPVMITGDHVVTASAIARELGIQRNADKAITGLQLDALTDSELDAQVDDISVYARVSPENKIRIVKAWQRKNAVVAMTGDGVNDAPALKAADIGCAMGITGTDVAKGAADMTLTDDNFATIIDAVKEGRGIYANIQKVTGFLLSTNIGEVITVFISMLFWHKSPLLSIQLLWINLITDSMPAIALGMEAVENDIMEQPPRPRGESLFAQGFGVRIALQGILFGILSLIAFRLGESQSTPAGGQTLTFMVLSLSQIVQAYNMRSEHSLFSVGIFSNHKLNQAALISILLVALILFSPLSALFGAVRLSPALYLTGLALIFVPLPATELMKALLHYVKNM